jgi:tRNA A58 N-methylase Trm61
MAGASVTIAGFTPIVVAVHYLDYCLRLMVLALALLNCGGLSGAEAPSPAVGPVPGTGTNVYRFREPTPDGIGKLMLGREISHVMGHEGADWLERPERETEERPEAVLRRLNLKPGETVADIGAGSGYFTRRLARAVGPRGRVFAVDIQPQMLTELTNRLTRAGITNVTPVLGADRDPRLSPASIDLALLVDVYHELEYPFEMMVAIARALKPGGRVVLVEYRAEDPAVPIKPLHKMSEAQARRELAAAGFEWLGTHPDLPSQHILEFRKRH